MLSYLKNGQSVSHVVLIQKMIWWILYDFIFCSWIISLYNLISFLYFKILYSNPIYFNHFICMSFNHFLGSCLSISFLDHVFQSLSWIMSFNHFLGSCLSITFLDHVFQSFSWIMSFNHFLGSCLSISFFLMNPWGCIDIHHDPRFTYLHKDPFSF